MEKQSSVAARNGFKWRPDEHIAMAKVLIADDHAVVRAGLRQLLSEDRAISEIGEAATGQQTLDRLRENHWELLILDIGMPDRSGLDILRHVRSGFPDTRILVLSGYPERQYAINVLRMGAHGYLGKDGAYLHKAKLSLDVSYLPNGAPSDQTQAGILAADEAEFVVRAQFQLMI